MERGGARRDRTKLRRRARDRTAGDNPSGRADRDRLKTSVPKPCPKGKASGDDRLIDAAGTVPKKAASETADGRPSGQIRSAATRRLEHLRWDV